MLQPSSALKASRRVPAGTRFSSANVPHNLSKLNPVSSAMDGNSTLAPLVKPTSRNKCYYHPCWNLTGRCSALSPDPLLGNGFPHSQFARR